LHCYAAFRLRTALHSTALLQAAQRCAALRSAAQLVAAHGIALLCRQFAYANYM